MRLAGTAKEYSTSAMLQPIRIAASIDRFGNFNCPYQASVMKMLEIQSSAIVVMPTALAVRRMKLQTAGTRRSLRGSCAPGHVLPSALLGSVARIVFRIDVGDSERAFAADLDLRRRAVRSPVVHPRLHGDVIPLGQRPRARLVDLVAHAVGERPAGQHPDH